MAEDIALLQVSGLQVTLGHGLRATEILHGVDLKVAKGSTVGLVGESGSGKSTIAKAIVGIHAPTAGRVEFDGWDLGRIPKRARRRLERRIQLIPQNPHSSLDPRRTIGQTLAEAIEPRSGSVRAHRSLIAETLELVAMDASAIGRYPHEFSGGQRQRIAIARALCTGADLLIADEITSALDASTQAEILALLARLREELNLTMLFISHNLAVVHQICDEVVVLLHGDVVEAGPVGTVFANPSSPYTRKLIESVPGGPTFTLDSVQA